MSNLKIHTRELNSRNLHIKNCQPFSRFWKNSWENHRFWETFGNVSKLAKTELIPSSVFWHSMYFRLVVRCNSKWLLRYAIGNHVTDTQVILHSSLASGWCATTGIDGIPTRRQTPITPHDLYLPTDWQLNQHAQKVKTHTYISQCCASLVYGFTQVKEKIV